MDLRLLVVLLPRPLEEFAAREHAEDLLRSAGAVAVEPARVSYRAFERLPEVAGIWLAGLQARRLERALPGTPRAVVVYDPLQYPLARALLARNPGAELWYGRMEDAPRGRRAEELHVLAAERSALTFVSSAVLGAEEARAGRQAVELPAGERPAIANAPLHERMARLEIGRPDRHRG